MLTEADAVLSITSDALDKFCVYIRVRINQVGHQEQYQPIIQINNNMKMHHSLLPDCSAVLETASFIYSKFCSSEPPQFQEIIILSFFFSKV